MSESLQDSVEFIGRTYGERVVSLAGARLLSGGNIGFALVHPLMWQRLFDEFLYKRDPTMRVHDYKKRTAVSFSVAICGKRTHLLADEAQPDEHLEWLK